MFANLLRFGIRQKIVLILLTTLVVGLTASTWIALRAQSDDILAETNRRGEEISHFVARILVSSVVSYDYHSVEMLLREIAGHGDIVFVRVTGPKGNAMGEFGPTRIDRTGVARFEHDIKANDDVVGRLEIGLNIERITAALARQQQDSILRQVLVIFGVLLVEFVALSYIIVRPLNLMSRAVREQAGAEGTAPMIPIATGDEFGAIAAQFNRLHLRLNDAHEKLKLRVEHANQELVHAYEQVTSQAEELRRKNADLELLSVTDPLTGLYNKRYFETLMESEVERAVAQNQICSILLIDVDHFKALNQRYGHKAGDGVLREIARLLALRTRKTDVLCRFGGDEFFLLCRQATMANAMNIAEQLHEAVTREPLLIDGQAIEVGLSVGIATIPSPRVVRTAGEFFECADQALHRSKQLGRNVIVHFSRMPAVRESGQS